MKPKPRIKRPQAAFEELREPEYPLFQSPPPPTENKAEDEMYDELERSLNRWDWMNVTEHWLNVTSNMPAPKPIPKRLLKDIPSEFHSWVGHWYGDDMYAVLAKAATATTPIDITLTNNQAYFDFLKCVIMFIRVLEPRIARLAHGCLLSQEQFHDRHLEKLARKKGSTAAA